MKARSRLRSAVYSAVTVLIALVVLEGAASWMMLVYYRASDQQKFETNDSSYLSVINVARRFSRLVALSEPSMVLEESSPSLFSAPIRCWATAGSVRHGRAVYLLHFAGSPDNPVRRKVSPAVQVIGAVRSEFDSVVQGDILGFDGHPGPYWHYASSRKLPGAIGRQL